MAVIKLLMKKLHKNYMSGISQEIINQAEGVPILQVASQLGIKVKGNRCNCVNPSHNDTNPSMSFNVKDNYYFCFSCKQGGNPITMVRMVKGCDFKEAITFLVGFDVNSQTNYTKPLNKHYSKHKKADFKPVVKSYSEKSIITQTNDFKPVTAKKPSFEFSRLYYDFISMLDVNEAIGYLASRGISRDVTLDFKIRCITKQGIGAVVRELKNKYSDDELYQSGLLSYGKLSLEGNRLVIPYIVDGNIVNLQGRNIDDTNEVIKASKGKLTRYKFLPNTKPTYYNQRALTENPNKKIALCEGVFDTLTVYVSGLWFEYGLPLGVAGVGNLKDDLIELLKGFDVNVFIHNDRAGFEMFSKFKELFYNRYGKLVKGFKLGAKDLNELYLKDITNVN